MRIVFTICSANYLAGARALSHSVKVHDPSSKFIYILADKLEGRIDADFFEGNDVYEAAELGIVHLPQMIAHYNITEFNTSLKPFALAFLHQRYNCDSFIYFDPDILLYHPIEFIWEKLLTNDFVVTPHILQPVVKKEFYGHQIGALNTGIFNLGFIAVRYHERSKSIIEWWKEHMIEHGHSNSLIGEFYDQKIMNLLPVHSDHVCILKHPGCNVAGWNIHERHVEKKNGQYQVNGMELIFWHYSGMYADAVETRISKYNELTVQERPAVKEILDHFRTELKGNKNEELAQLKCHYDLLPDVHRASRFAMFTYKISKLFKG